MNILFENAGVEAGEDVFNICHLSKVNNSMSFSGFSPVLGNAGPKVCLQFENSFSFSYQLLNYLISIK